MNGNTTIVSTTDFLRNSGKYLNLIPRVEEMLLVRDGRKFATVKATPEEKNRELLKFLDTHDRSLWDDDKVWDKVWKAVAVRRNRKKPIRL